MASFRMMEHPVLGLHVVKVGFSWPGFFCGIFWALYKRMWLLSGILAALMVATMVVLVLFVTNGSTFDTWTNVGTLVFALICGFDGNRLFATMLESQGYEQQAQIEAGNISKALAIYVQEKADSSVNAALQAEQARTT